MPTLRDVQWCEKMLKHERYRRIWRAIVKNIDAALNRITVRLLMTRVIVRSSAVRSNPPRPPRFKRVACRVDRIA